MAVSPPKSFPGMAESTFLSRSFADQGVKLRIRKEPRTVMSVGLFWSLSTFCVFGSRSLTMRCRKRTGPRPEDFPQPLPPRSPDRSSLQMSGSVFGGYPAANRDYTYYGGPVKRSRTSMDYGTRSIYDVDGRMVRQMDTYSTASGMYPSQTYQTPLLQGYAATTPRPAGVPDYSVRQPPLTTTATAQTYATSQDPKIPPSWNWIDFGRSSHR